jgi:hypothetical protein
VTSNGGGKRYRTSYLGSLSSISGTDTSQAFMVFTATEPHINGISK